MIDLTALLQPIPGDNPSGEDQRYSGVYEDIKEARREDEVLDQGDWQSDIKKADWEKVIKVAADALETKTKDLQIAAWLTEALIKKEGFAGLAKGLSLITSLINDFWDTLYPQIEDDDLEYRIGPLEFLNEKVSPLVRGISLTDSKATESYSWFNWQESRQSGKEDGVSLEDFNTGVARSSKAFYAKLSSEADAALEAFSKMDTSIDEKFGSDAPRLSELSQAIEDCQHVVNNLFKEKGGVPASEQTAEAQAEGGTPDPGQEAQASSGAGFAAPPAAGQVAIPMIPVGDQASFEEAIWADAEGTLLKSGVKEALSKLLAASCSATSIRQQNRYRLMMAKIANKADRPDISRPILEELYTLIQDLKLESWESPIWIAEVIEAYYQCLTAEGASNDDIYKANGELYPKLCSKDITKALQYKKGG
jgi:type VI secretion system protein ImpA